MHSLAQRELDVLKAAADGLSMDETAKALGISTSTVQTYRRSIGSKLLARNLTHAVAIALRSGMID